VTDREGDETMTLQVELHQEPNTRAKTARIGRMVVTDNGRTRVEHPGTMYRFWYDPGPNRWRWAREGFADDGIGLPHHGAELTLQTAVKAACICEAEERAIPESERSRVGSGGYGRV